MFESSIHKQLILSLALCFFTISCSSMAKKAGDAQDSQGSSSALTGSPAPGPSAEPAPTPEPEPPTSSQIEIEIKKSAPTEQLPPPQKVDEHPQDSAHSAHHEKPHGTDPKIAMGWLKNGNTRYLKGFLRKDGQAPQDIKRLSTGQKPHTIILSCSDSRVPPEVLFDQKLGEVFVIRTAGQALDHNAIGSIEYAVEHLGTRLILVMGHTSCGAVKAALSTLSGKDAGSPSLNALVADIHPRIKNFSGMPESKHTEAESFANTRGVARDLVTRSALLKAAVGSGDVVIKSALYELHSGKVVFDE
jgi:carbonic anhydrase